MIATARKLAQSTLCAVLLPFAALSAFAQTTALAPRITAAIDNSSRVPLAGSHPLRALAANDIGRVPASTQLQGVTLVFSKSPAQQAAIETLIAAQQNPSSPLFHQWLTPDQFGARFGMADSDISTAEAWLQQQGFTITGVARSRDSISFNGTVAQVEAAFGTEIHNYKSATDAVSHFAPATDLSLPAALASSVLAVTHLSSFQPRPHLILKAPQPAPNFTSNFTSAQSGSNFLTPGDVSTIYDINAAYNSGYNGTGENIAVVGQSAVITTDISNFQTAAGVPVRLPTLKLYPNTGASTVYSGDEAESDLDLEYTSGIAKGASIYFYYTGSSPNYGVFDALQYAVNDDIASIISVSYGACEPLLGTTGYGELNAIVQQGATQGQSIISAAGDAGSTDCSGETGATTAQAQAVAADYPASSQYVTGMGGTEFPANDVVAGNSTYWNIPSGSDIISSAKSYIPEQVWNDDSAANGLSSGGGGISIYTPRPSWQTGVPGIPAGSFRLVPDISLTSSPNDAGYLYCSSDTSSTSVTGSCSNGFRDANNEYLTVAGGTSFAAPVFAGMLAIINQAKGFTPSSGQGVINPTLYTLASNTTTYATAFHDITSGGNQCLSGSATCGTGTQTTSYAAGVGYDEASGLGSVDLDKLLLAWPSNVVSLTSSTTTLSAATLTPAAGVADLITIKVASGSSSVSAIPTGSVSVSVDGAVVNSSLVLVAGVATYSFSSITAGSHTVAVTYSGDSTFSGSTANLTLNVGSTAVASTVTLGAATLTPLSGATDVITIAVASASATTTAVPTGTVSVSVNGTVVNSALPLVNGAATYTFSSTTAGTNTVAVTYSGSTTYLASTASLTLTLPTPAITVTAPAVAVTRGTAGTNTITVTPSGGFTGAVNFTVSGSLAYACYSLPSTTVSGTTAATSTMTIETNQSSCGSGFSTLLRNGNTLKAEATPNTNHHNSPLVPFSAAALAGLLLAAGFNRRARRLLSRTTLSVVLLALLGLSLSALTGCGGGTTTTPPPVTYITTAGSYTVTVIAQSAANSSVSSTTTFTLTAN